MDDSEAGYDGRRRRAMATVGTAGCEAADRCRLWRWWHDGGGGGGWCREEGAAGSEARLLVVLVLGGAKCRVLLLWLLLFLVSCGMARAPLA